MAYEQGVFPGQGPIDYGRIPYYLTLKEGGPRDEPVGPVGFGTLDELTTEGQQFMLERLNRPVKSYVCRLLGYLRAQEIAMARDMDPYSGYSRNAMYQLVWAFGQPGSVDPLERSRFKISSWFGAVVDYCALWTGMFDTHDEIIEFCRRPGFLEPYVFEHNPKKVVKPSDIDPGVVLAMIHGRYEGGFLHPGHARAIENLEKLKRSNPRVRLLLAVDSAFCFAAGHNPLVSPLFSLSVASLYPGIDYVLELTGPNNTHWRSPYEYEGPGLREQPVWYGDEKAWDAYYQQLYLDWKVRYVHVREDDPNFKKRVDRALSVGVEPVIHEKMKDRPVYSDSILRDIARGWVRDPYTGELYVTDYEEEREDMGINIVLKEIPALEERIRKEKEWLN